MRMNVYNDIHKFIDDTMEVVAQHEIQNNVIISNILRGRDGADTSRWFMATVSDKAGSLVLVAIMTPPFNLVLYEVGNLPQERAIQLLAQTAVEQGLQIPGVLAEKSLAERFAVQYAAASGKQTTNGMNMRIYRLDAVEDVPQVPGKLRAAKEEDLYFLPYWSLAFADDCAVHKTDILSTVEKLKNQIANHGLYLWEDNIPVSQAAMGRKTLHGAVVNAVYTPPFYRGKGYATSCVAGLSKHLLECGYRFCSLFTDLANPISNSIYMKIGYKPVCDYDEYHFTGGKDNG